MKTHRKTGQEGAGAKRKTESPLKKINRWIASSVAGKTGVTLDQLYEAGWEAGQSGSAELDGVHYELFSVAGGHVVVEWDENGYLAVL